MLKTRLLTVLGSAPGLADGLTLTGAQLTHGVLGPVRGDAKLSEEEKAKQVAALTAQLAKLDELEKKAAADGFQPRVAAFLEAEKAGQQDELKKMIAEFAATSAHTN